MKKNAKPAKGTFPLTRSLLLQDLSIALGRRLKSVRKQNRTLTVECDRERGENAEERLNFEARSFLDDLTKIVVWEDGIAWVFYRHGKGGSMGPLFEQHANLTPMDAEEMAELIRLTLTDFDAAKSFWMRFGMDA